MNYFIGKRVLELAQYIIDTQDTVRGAAAKFCISKSTVHKDITERLEKLNRPMFLRVREILLLHLDERHLRGGEATKNKYIKLKEGLQ